VKITICQQRSPLLIEQLVQLWEGSVRATHAFLNDAAIREIKVDVPAALQNVPTLVVASDAAAVPVGFMGVAADKLEMLFVAADARGQGVGRQLLQFGLAQFDLRTVLVNEQNPQARGFYEHMGFQVVSRSELDEQGRAYPVLTLQRQGFGRGYSVLPQ
jgi:putative acetyltransferase